MTVFDVDTFQAEARAWLESSAPLRDVTPKETAWGAGSDSVAVFPDISRDEELAIVAAARDWQQRKFDAGFGAITWPVEFGGRGLPRSFERVFHREEQRFDVTVARDLLAISFDLVGPTLQVHGTDEQRARFLPPLLRTDEIWCQLFSEPGAGSDLASLSTSAVRDGDTWVLNGQKVWTSGAHFSDWGYALCRTDQSEKHAGITAFLIPMTDPGVEVRALRQMSGGASFNEVFIDDVRVGDDMRLGEVGEGWKVALTTLAFERSSSNGTEGGGKPIGGTYRQVLALAQHLGRTSDPLARQELMELYTRHRLMQLNRQRVAAGMQAGKQPGPEGSIGKLVWVTQMRRLGEVAANLLGPAITADTGAWGTYAWAEHLLGAPGYRIAGGSDEVQRNIIGERVLGLPHEPRPSPSPNGGKV